MHAYGALIERKSRVLTVRIDERLETMPAPTLQGAIDDNVDPVDVVGDSVLLTLPYTATRSRDHIQWNIVGTGLAMVRASIGTPTSLVSGLPQPVSTVLPSRSAVTHFTENDSL